MKTIIYHSTLCPYFQCVVILSHILHLTWEFRAAVIIGEKTSHKITRVENRDPESLYSNCDFEWSILFEKGHFKVLSFFEYKFSVSSTSLLDIIYSHFNKSETFFWIHYFTFNIIKSTFNIQYMETIFGTDIFVQYLYE